MGPKIDLLRRNNVVEILPYFIEKDHFWGVEYVLDYGRDPDIPLPNGKSPLEYSRLFAAEETMQILLEHGANPD